MAFPTPPSPNATSRPPRLRQLDGLRGFTATYVVFHNWAGSTTTLPVWLQKGLLSFGQEAVMVFFLLSGFVIYWSSIGRSRQSFYQYFIRRFRRIYFPFLAAIVLVFLIAISNNGWRAIIGDPDFWPTLAGNLIMTQELSALKPGTWFNPFLGNLPFWTLTYEWWFYFLFFLVCRFLFHRPWRLLAITLFSLVNFLIYTQSPNLVSLVCSYFVLWWSGVELAIKVHHKKISWKSLFPTLSAMAIMTAITTGPVITSDSIRPGLYPFLPLRHFATVLIFLILAKLWYDQRPKIIETVLRPFETVAPMSYALYLFHYPILVIWQLDFLDQNLWIIIPIKLTLLILLSYWVEVKLQPKVNQIVR